MVFMSKCIFNDHSYNYALLDLVFDIEDDFYIEKELDLCIRETIEQAILIALNTFQSFNFCPIQQGSDTFIQFVNSCTKSFNGKVDLDS